jgi:hypothetical protein
MQVPYSWYLKHIFGYQLLLYNINIVVFMQFHKENSKRTVKDSGLLSWIHTGIVCYGFVVLNYPAMNKSNVATMSELSTSIVTILLKIRI